MSDPLLGARVRDNQSGYEGLVTARINFHTGCWHYVVEATSLKEDGTIIAFYEFDPQRLKVVEGSHGQHVIVEPSSELWANASDMVTGFAGFVSATKVSIYCPPQVCIEPKGLRPDGELNRPEWFFESRVLVESTRKAKRPRPERDPIAPHGYNEDGTPKAPYGHKKDGTVKITRGGPSVYGSGIGGVR